MGNPPPADAGNDADTFITRWADSGASERANYQGFLIELCDLLGVERPAPSHADDSRNTYVFEKAVTFPNADGTSSTGRIDLYRRAHFVCETQRGGWHRSPVLRRPVRVDPGGTSTGLPRTADLWNPATERNEQSTRYEEVSHERNW